MATWIAELPVQIYYGREVEGFAQDDDGVDVGEPARADPLRLEAVGQARHGRAREARGDEVVEVEVKGAE